MRSTPIYKLTPRESWFQNNTTHHIYIPAPLARALGAPDTEEHVRVAVYVDNINRANGKLNGTTWFLTEVDVLFDVLRLTRADVGRPSIGAQGRPGKDGLDLHFWELNNQSLVEADKLMVDDQPSVDPPVKEREDTEPLENLDDDLSRDVHWEGAVRQVLVNGYERDPALRKACIGHWGSSCVACGFDFSKAYGQLGAGFIHVHHLVPLADVGSGHIVDPIEDMRPLCANCHAVVHRYRPCMTMDALKAAIRSERT